MQPSCIIEIQPATPVTKNHSKNFHKTDPIIDYSQNSIINNNQSNNNNNNDNLSIESIHNYLEIKPSNSSINQSIKSSNIRKYSKNIHSNIILTKSNTHIPSWRTHKYVIAFRAIIVRIGFICFTCTAIVSVVKEKQDGRFWFLALTIIPLLIDLIVAINAYVSGRSVTPTISKWFSLCNFTYLICACPPIWIIELHHMDQVNNASALFELMTTKNHTPIITVPAWINKAPSVISRENESMMIMGTEIEEFMNSAYLTTKEPQRTKRMTRNTFIHEVLSNETIGLQVSMDVLQSLQLHNFSLKERIRILEQLLLLSVIVGRWLMPREGLTRDQLSQLLLINIGTAADILELFEAFNEQEVRRNDFLRTVILSLWQASLLQFCFNKTALKTQKNYNNRNLLLSKSNELSSFQSSMDEKSLSDGESRFTANNSNNNTNSNDSDNVASNLKNKSLRRNTLAYLKQWYLTRKNQKREPENPDHDNCIITNVECGSTLKIPESDVQRQQQQQSAQLLVPPLTLSSSPSSSKIDGIPKSVSQNDFIDNSNNVNCPLIGGCLLLCRERPCLCCETELWAIGISLMLQDLPFLILRITLIVYYNVKSYSNVFFTCKNTLLILLQVFRSIVILSEAGKFNPF
ncbi:hypothetical protein MS3_00010427 [Schistosoma haematobium]|uniref:Transmembrane protein 26 n=1 Tax=Schistosoma haematobium TaxID=6185 RepID=A0A922LRC7_SCHHA|nr:hypothetical protein MS3_00010427 [Schistosoma haematobium]KAH9591774.1 hypothetical protein MS3_00010427 [Schistosoma haematobium]